jgi:hypothetical protein
MWEYNRDWLLHRQMLPEDILGNPEMHIHQRSFVSNKTFHPPNPVDKILEVQHKRSLFTNSKMTIAIDNAIRTNRKERWRIFHRGIVKMAKNTHIT